MERCNVSHHLANDPHQMSRPYIKTLKTIIMLAVVILPVAAGCYYDSEEYLFPTIGTSCDTTNVTFSDQVTSILDNRCLSCHSNSTAAAFGGNIRLEDYADVKARVDDMRLQGSINHDPGYSPMPMGASKLDACSLSMIRVWIESGAPNN